MTDIVEHVAREMNGDFWDAFDVFCKAKGFTDEQIAAEKAQSGMVAAMRLRASGSIIATLQWARDNVSDKAAFAGMLAIVGEKIDFGSDTEDAKACFRAVIDTLLQEIGGGKT